MSSRRRRRARTRSLHRFLWLLPGLLLLAGLVAAEQGRQEVAKRDTTTRALAPAPAHVSAAVYPPRSSSLRFDHARHRDVSCVSCHGAATTSRRASDRLTPPMEACVDCHGDGGAEPTLERCAGCHAGHPSAATEPIRSPEAWRDLRPAPMIVPAAAANLRFDHRAHLQAASKGADATCTSCHGAGEAIAMPSMASCVSCHDGTTAPDACATCHPTGEKGRLRTSFQGAAARLRPTNHGVDWEKRHGAIAKANPTACATCHDEPDCASCHTEELAVPFRVHPPGFLTVHQVDARASLGDCTDCHDTESFCTSCHVRAEVVTRAAASPPPRLEYHPPGWLDASMPNNHGVMARRNIVECASCHQESDCVACHTGINPHPPQFPLDCRRWLDANPAPCARCHGDLRAVRALCR